MSKKVAYPKLDKRDVELCIARFDFDKVFQVMEALDWGWSKLHDSEITEVPDVEELKFAAHNLLTDCLNSGTQHSSGGFIAKIEEGILVLSFVVEESDSQI